VIRQTQQRLAIESVLRHAGRPVTLAEVHALAQASLPRIGLRTIYRQMRDLAADGRVLGLDYPGQPLRYELASSHDHAHFICRSCNRVFDIDASIPDVDVTMPPGFTLSGQETVLYGVCAACSALAG
jgi:Fur family transcriptional regulator, ferric uptake regulator